MLASVYDVPLAERKATPLVKLMDVAARNAERGGRLKPEPGPDGAAGRRRRAQIWEISPNLHCSIIGTCLSPGELRRLLVRLNVAGAETAGDHDAHLLGVLLAARPKEGAKLLQKALDRRHRGALNRFGKAPDAAALCALWEEAMGGGDIPGAYWALLTHPLATNEMVRHAFGDVHMLSHLVGATNRADLARLRELERQNAALGERLERQQRQLREGFLSRDATIRRLSDEIERAACDVAPRAGDDTSALKETIASLQERSLRESERRAIAEQRLRAAAEELDEAKAARLAAERERDALQGELGSIEAEIEALLRGGERADADGIALGGTAILYIGGRAGQVPQIKALIERCGGRFLHHDGGLEHNPALLPGLVGRADVSLFPVDCVSHDAVAAVKRVCRQAGKPYRPLRTASLSALLSTLATLAPPRSTASAQ
jgi:hypothetical protein